MHLTAYIDISYDVNIDVNQWDDSALTHCYTEWRYISLLNVHSVNGFEVNTFVNLPQVPSEGQTVILSSSTDPGEAPRSVFLFFLSPSEILLASQTMVCLLDDLWTGRGHNCSVASLLPKTQQEFKSRWVFHLTWWPYESTNTNHYLKSIWQPMTTDNMMKEHWKVMNLTLWKSFISWLSSTGRLNHHCVPKVVFTPDQEDAVWLGIRKL